MGARGHASPAGIRPPPRTSTGYFFPEGLRRASAMAAPAPIALIKLASSSSASPAPPSRTASPVPATDSSARIRSGDASCSIYGSNGSPSACSPRAAIPRNRTGKTTGARRRPSPTLSCRCCRRRTSRCCRRRRRASRWWCRPGHAAPAARFQSRRRSAGGSPGRARPPHGIAPALSTRPRTLDPTAAPPTNTGRLEDDNRFRSERRFNPDHRLLGDLQFDV